MWYRIYQISNTGNILLYVGHTTGELQQRFRTHIQASRSHSARLQSNPLYIAMRQYGTENFTISLLEEGQKEYYEILDRERYWMVQLDSIYPHGYNRVCPALSSEDAAIIRYNAYGLKNAEYAALFRLSAKTIPQIRATVGRTYYRHITRNHLPVDIAAYATRMGHTAMIKEMRMKRDRQE